MDNVNIQWYEKRNAWIRNEDKSMKQILFTVGITGKAKTLVDQQKLGELTERKHSRFPS